MCRPHRRFAPLLPRTLRRIPQAVSTVATIDDKLKYIFNDLDGFNTVNGKYCCNLSAVKNMNTLSYEGFNTASGKYCCNAVTFLLHLHKTASVSIPQAVSTVATSLFGALYIPHSCKAFQYRKR